MPTQPGDGTVPLDDLLRQARGTLASAGIEDAALDARLLVSHFSGIDRVGAITNPRQPVPANRVAAVREALARRAGGEPVHRIIGMRSFYGLDLELSAETLEPRPDTETLVDIVLPRAQAVLARKGACRILDLGTGTGAVALALLSQLPGATALGVDLAPGAVRTARLNAERNGLADRFEAEVSDWFTKSFGAWDFIVSNPPYIRHDDVGRLARDVRDFDPALALDGGIDGLDAYRVIAGEAKRFLADGGMVAVEIGYDQRQSVTGLFLDRGFRLIEARKDLAGHDRALMFGSS